MQLATFLAQFKHYVPGTVKVVELVCSSEFPLMFDQFKRFFSRREQKAVINSTPAQLMSPGYKAQLLTSFLGTQHLFVLDGMLPSTLQACLVSLLKTYQGPHTVLYATHKSLFPKDLPAHQLSILVPNKIGIREVEKYAPLFKKSCSYRLDELASLAVLDRPVLSLDQLCQLDRYVSCISSGSGNSNLIDLMAPIFQKNSLFSLSDALFSRDTSRFFAEWMQQKKRFSTQFWIFYFSEQSWLAYQFVLAKKEHQVVDRTCEKRLPFSFTRSGNWKQWKLHQLTCMHDVFLFVDIAIKRGASEDILDSVLQLILTKSNFQFIERAYQALWFVS